MVTLTEEQKTQFRGQILNAITSLTNEENDGWLKPIDLGPIIKQAGIDYKNMGFTKLTNFLNDIFEPQFHLDWRGEKLTLEVKFPTSANTDNDSSVTENGVSTSKDTHEYSNIAPYMVRNSYRELLKDPSAQNGWVRVKYLLDAVNWKGTVTDFSKKFGLKIKAPNLVRISNISRYEIVDDIYFEPQRNSYPENIKKLREMSLSEQWDDSKPNGLLDNYICYTYARIKEENKIAMSEDGLCGCWNTGLVDMRYLPIYCYMTRKNPKERWVFQGFCIEGEDLGKEIVSNIAKSPLRAMYFTNDNLLFESDSSKLSVDSTHIIEEHPSRLPKEWVKDTLGDAATKLEDEEPFRYDERVGKLISADKKASTNLTKQLKEAIDISLTRCQWNYKTAIPYYDPNSKGIGWFLPLCKQSKEGHVPFAALVVTKQKSGRYQGQTIYKLSWAYRCARLVCRPDSDWLSPSCAADDDDE